MDDDDSFDTADLAAARPLPTSSSNDTVGSTASQRQQDIEDDYEMTFDLDQDHHSSSRPPTSHRVSGNRHDERDESQPDNDADDDDQDAATHTREIATEPQRSLKADDIPDLRPPATSQSQQQETKEPKDQGLSPGEATYADRSSVLPTRKDPNDSYIARVIGRNLQDIESSFTTPLSPLPTVNSLGFDDTFVFDSPSKPPKSSPSSSTKPLGPTSHPSNREKSSLSTISGHSPDTRASPVPKQEPYSEEQSHHAPSETSALEAFSSSPTGATTARTVSRARSRASSVKGKVVPDNGNFSNDDDSMVQPNQTADDVFLQAGSTAGDLHNPYKNSGNSERSIPKISVDAGSTPGNALKGGSRPKYLRSRMGSSQRSSDSSYGAEDAESNATVGTGNLLAEYGLPSGGSIPALNMSRNSSMSNILTRQISLGSMASDFREESTGRVGLEPLTEDEAFNPSEQLKTPTAPKQPLTEPTDTVIARHVRNVQVPESLAREYKTKSGLITPMRKMSEVNLGASASTTRTGRNLTLKEQSSTIERLSKENFDLKLKVMFLSDRLDKLSEEGIKEMISENVELKTSLAVLQRDNKVLRRRAKELEKKLKDEDGRPGTARSVASSFGPTAEEYEQHAANEEELIYLRERVDEFITEIDRLKQENLNKEAEKRRMAEVVKSLQTINESRLGDSLGQDDETEVWRELYSQETGRREQAEEENQRVSDENKKLRDEIFRLKQEMANGTSHSGTTSSGQPSGLHHTTNIYNITRKPRAESPTRSRSRMSEAETMTGTMSVSVTLVEELRRESEQLRHENAELRREVGAQTSMLTSRNREKERLYQEIEDLKMAQRRNGTGGSTLDSILERSASRAGVQDRPMSRGSQNTHTATMLEDPEREELENKMAELRDKLNTVKMQNQDLQQELNTYMNEYEAELESRKQTEAAALQLQEELEVTQNDLISLQQERDELLQENSGMDEEFNNLRAEAQDEIDQLEAEAEQRDAEIARLNQELTERSEIQEALQEEMRRLSDDMIRFEDTQETQLRRIKQLEEELTQANGELEELEGKLVSANDKVERLGIQQESNQGEIAFLREEQEGDKLKIGDLVGQVAQLEVVIREEKDKTKELETQIQNERQQHEIVTNQEKEDVQQFVNQLNREMTAAKEEARKLRKSLSKESIEAAEWKERLLELENNLREALGDLNGTRSSFLRDISKLQNDLDATCRELDTTRTSLNEKEHLLKQRDELLETSALEARRLAEMFDKEKQLHRGTKHQLETYQKTQQHIHGSMSTAELRIKELETSKDRDKRALAKLEATFKEQLNERNSLLLVLWTRLSSICGTDWAHDNSLINGRALPSLESVATMLPGFSKNLLGAVKTIESIVGKFQDRVKSVERELWKEYQHLEESLDKRVKKLDKLESIVRNGVATGALGPGNASVSESILESMRARMTKLEDAYRQLKVENATLRTANDVRARTSSRGGDRAFEGNDNGSPSPAVPTGPSKHTERTTSRHSSKTYAPAMSLSSSSSSVRRETSRPSMLSRARTELGDSGEGTSRPSTVARASTENDATAFGQLLSHKNNNMELTAPAAVLSPGAPPDSDIKWMHRLKDLEGKLKAEREGRMLDRSEASRRLLDLEEVAREAQAREAKREKHRRLGLPGGRKSPATGGQRSGSAAGN
ncbi:hypothetical protein N0V93_007933 [Gnomoniopsis smithogilvyi]|uniref:Anucleate primary sterigmata protein B n=1 Tax=Gnomoniopsis smithogilvyi TaxID=1191159 RepID=A0A9W8YPC0_9PEZI|nr:hypothetical protein N0V93_007933 [Gnomoniopsis smithogilvyi]